ncbi:MAG: hypothetical protein OEW52_09205 [Thermoleophilia bacterium]|nr:hypothetical protein [Thermoleophilia bacterium]MDH4339512.1 hypothetical protein [Thermoleophilia bacterium]MDH5281308.1 hypothetical protein [Thermoleophilia bacterium]
MGSTTALLTRRRAGALTALLAALVAYGAGAEHLPGLPSGLDVAFHSAVVFPAFAAAIWIALPLARAGNRVLLASAAVVGVAALTLTLLDVDSAANVAKLACYALVGFWFLTLFEELWWIALVAVLVPWVDIWSVASGPTEYVVEQRPGLFERISVAFPNPGETATVNIGPPDILFFALFLAAADRFALRVMWTWLGMAGFLAGTLVLVWTWDGIAGLPALPAVCLGFLIPNADLLWRNVRDVRSRATSLE